MDDEDFKVDDDITDDGGELKIVPVNQDEKVEDKDDRFNAEPSLNNWNDNYKEKEKKGYVDDLNVSTEDVRNSYSYNTPSSDRGLYGIDNSNKIVMHEYGTYERKEEKSYFRPSPIISPIYGILDKNYKKEDVVQKREVKLSNSFERDKVSIDDVRKKAYGSISDDLADNFKDENDNSSFEVEDKQDENLLVDLNDDKPTVKEVTMGDAVEYFEDLGLEYNVDYVDEAKNNKKQEEVVVEEPKEEVKEEKEEKKVEPEKEEEKVEDIIEEVKEEVEETEDKKDDDNLFDLIDSMYQE